MTIPRNRYCFGGGLIFYINEQIASKFPTLESIPRDTKIILLDFKPKNPERLCIRLYKPTSQNNKYFRLKILSSIKNIRSVDLLI